MSNIFVCVCVCAAAEQINFIVWSRVKMSQQKKFDTMTLEPGAVEEVFVGHITDPDNFYVQLARTAESLEDIMSLLTVLQFLPLVTCLFKAV